MIRLLIVDDHPIVRYGLKQIIAETSDMSLADEAGSAQEALTKMRENNYDVVLLDIALPGTSGIEVLKDIKRLKPKLPVLIISVYDEEIYAVRTIRAGASGYLVKSSAPDELMAAIRKVCSGGKYITPSVAEKLAGALDSNTEKPVHELLSDREFQVMCMIAQGKTVKEIAEKLCLSPKTISTYRARILEKTKMKNSAELMQYAIAHGLVE